MKEKSQLKKNAWKFLLIALSLLGLGIAMITYRYTIIVRGVLGFAVSYSLFFYLQHSRIKVPFNKLSSTHDRVEYISYMFIGPLLAYWAMMEFINMIKFFLWK
jgi:hypothetical protein